MISDPNTNTVHYNGQERGKDWERKKNFLVFFRIQGFLLLVEGLAMLAVLPVTWLHHGIYAYSMPFSALITLLTSFILFVASHKAKGVRITSHNGVFIVSVSWLTLSLFGCLPYLIGQTLPNFTDAFFEAMSGFTTTGSTMIADVESVPKDILLWRSLTQWMGGFGIIVFSITILPLLSLSGMQLFVSEMNGLTYDKLHPRIMHTTRWIWSLYLFFTLLEILLLQWGDMDLFDAVCHSMSTLSSGGFSTKNDSIAGFSNYSQIVITCFMVLSGCNFSLLLLSLGRKPFAIFKNQEFRCFITGILFFSIAIGFTLITIQSYSVGSAVREGFFGVISIMTTTGFFVSDYLLWPQILWTILIFLMFVGACSGSTSGGLKVIRVMIFVKNAFLELKRIIHPNALIPVKVNGKALSRNVIMKNTTFVFVYFLVFLAGMLTLRSQGVDYVTALGAAVANLSNIGTGIGHVGPNGTYAFMPQLSKWILMLFMLLGRIELFTLILLLSKNFWKR